MDVNKSQGVYNGTWTLKNKLGLTNIHKLERADRLFSRVRAREGIPFGKFDIAHLKAIHQHLFQDIYEWAGELRNKDKWKENTHFVRHESIQSILGNVLNLLKESNHLKGLKQHEFTEKAAIYYGRLNEVQAFREGNGRIQRALFTQIATEAGYKIDWSKFNLEQWRDANIESTKGNDSLMIDAFRKATVQLVVTPELRQKALNGAFSKLPKEQAIKLFPELVDLYKMRNNAAEFAEIKLGLHHEKVPDLISKIISRSIQELSKGNGLPMKKIKVKDKEMGI